MKKLWQNVLFWLLYWVLIAYLEYFWLQDYSSGWSSGKLLTRSVAAAFFYLLPHMAFANYLVYVGLSKLIQQKRPAILNALYILIPYLLAIIAVVLIAHLIVLPQIYENIVVPVTFFIEPRKFLSIMIETAFPAGLLLAITFVNTQLAVKEREKNMLREKLTTELKLLKNQMNPHFLFNTLNNIYALTRKKSDQAPEVVLKLSELLSFMLYESGSETISLKREISFLEDYISLQRIRYTDRLSLTFTKEIDDQDQPIAPLLLLPLVENAFKHGAGENHFDSFININLSLRKGQLSFLVKNSFEEIETGTSVPSIGLSNTIRQLELLYGEQQLLVEKKDRIFIVQLIVNLNSYGKI